MNVPAQATRTVLIQPHAELADCVRGYVVRSTVGADLHAHERHNFFPAALNCSISWTIEGETHMVRMGDQFISSPAPSPIMFSGPQTVPSETRNPGPVHFFLCMLLPDAVRALTGIDVQAHTNRHSPLHAVLDDEWKAVSEAIQTARDDAERVQWIEAFLLPRWQQVRAGALRRGPEERDWMQGLALRAAASGHGRSLRQTERRVKTWTGQTLRQLQRLHRGEALFVRARQAQLEGALKWADLAAAHGYADQSHLCRDFRKLSGLRLTQVFGAMRSDERFWIFRIWEHALPPRDLGDG